MILDMVDLSNVLTSFELTLRLEYPEGEKDVGRIIQSAVNRLENTYRCRFDESVYSVQAKMELVSTDLGPFLTSVLECTQRLALLTTMAMFTKRKVVDLADVNYLGFPAEKLNTVLAYLSDRVLYENRVAYIPTITNALNNVDMCQIKRLFLVMLTLERLGISEGVAACAQLMWLGGRTL